MNVTHEKCKRNSFLGKQQIYQKENKSPVKLRN